MKILKFQAQINLKINSLGNTGFLKLLNCPKQLSQSKLIFSKPELGSDAVSELEI